MRHADQRELANRIATVVEPRGVRCSFRPFDAGADVPALVAFFGEALHRWGERGFEVWLNAGTGPRRAALAAYEAAREARQPVFAVEPRRDRLVWLHPPDRPGVNLADRLDLAAYLLLYGATVEERGSHGRAGRGRWDLGHRWALEAPVLSRALATLNHLAAHARGDPPASPPVEARTRRDPALARLAADLGALGLARWDGDRLVFSGDDARFFANGGWLEEWVYGLVRGLRTECPGVRDVGRGVVIARPGGDAPVRNELDVAFVADNRLHVVECKTKRFHDAQAAGALYKLDAITELAGGLNARAMLVSYQPLARYDRARAQALGIRTADQDELAGLRDRLRAWIAGP